MLQAYIVTNGYAARIPDTEARTAEDCAARVRAFAASHFAADRAAAFERSARVAPVRHYGATPIAILIEPLPPAFGASGFVSRVPLAKVGHIRGEA